jgi:translocation and assembly module TamB
VTQLSPAPPPPSTSTSARSSTLAGVRRARRWLVRALVALGALVVALVVLVSQLDHPWIRPRVRQLLRASTGYDVDYGQVQVGLWPALHVELGALVVHAPRPLWPSASELLRVDRVRVHFAPSALFGAAPWLPRVELGQVALQMVVDEHGQSSLSRPVAAPGGARAPTTPLSQRASSILGGKLPIGRLHARELTLTLLRIERGALVERSTLRGLAVDALAQPLAHGTRIRVTLGTPATPLALAFEHERAQQRKLAAARVWLTLDATAHAAHIALDARLTRQDFVLALPLDVLARLDATASFEPQRGRTALHLAELEVADGAVFCEGTLLIPDRGAPNVLHAAGQIDALHLAELAAAWSLPLRLRAGHLRYRIDELVFDRPASSANVQVEGKLVGVGLELAGSQLGLGDAELSLHARPGAAGLQIEGTATLDALRVERAGEDPLRAADVGLSLSALQAHDGAISGEASLRFGQLASRGTTARSASGGRLSLRSIGPLAAGRPLALDAQLDLERLQIVAPDARVLADLPLRLRAAVRDLVLDRAAPERSLGAVRATLEAGALHAELEADRGASDLTFDLRVDAAQLGELVPWLPASAVRRVRWDKLGLALHSTGTLTELDAAQPRLRQQTQLSLARASIDDLTVRALALELRSAGTRLRHEGQATLALEGLRAGDAELGRDQLSLRVSLDRVRPTLHVELTNDRLPATLLDASLAFDRRKRALTYEVSAQLSHLAPVVGLLASQRALKGFDLTDSALSLRSEGTLTGVVSRVDARGITLAPDVLRSASGRASVELGGTGLRWASGDNAVHVPAATLLLTLRGDGVRRWLESELSLQQLEGTFDQQQIALTGFHDQTSVTLTGGLDGPIEHTQQLSIASLQQQIVPSYVIGDLRASLAIQRDREGLIKLSELRIDNRAGGTQLALSGGMELGLDERRLSLRSTLEQDLARFSNRADTFEGRGHVAVEAALSSPDLRVFHSAAKLRLRGATVRLPREQVALDVIDGELPIQTDFVVGSDGVEILRGARINPYTAQRFADQHPLLGYRSFVSIARVQTPFVSLAPFAANLEVARNIVSLSQLEMGVRGGTITGNGIFEYNGADSILHANMRASGVNSSHDEPFDGNAALTIGVRERSIEGRADILRIGRRHLTDLLDLQDPLRADPSISQIRSALRFGYPDRVRLSFQQGFASAGVNFGGLARLIKLNDVRGIPVGPLMERVMSSLYPAEVP